jgi:hypothetical protein
MLTRHQHRSLLLVIAISLLLFGSGPCLAQVGQLMYDSIPRQLPDTLPVFHDYNRHAFFGYEQCERYIDLKYGFVEQYHGRVARIGWRVMKYDWLNRRWSRQMRRRNGRGWTDAYYWDLHACREEAVFRDFAGTLPDTTFARIQRISSKAQLLRIPPRQWLHYLSTTTHHYLRTAEGKDVLGDMRRNVKYQVTAQDNWVQKADVAELINYIYAERGVARRACLCADTVLPGPATTLALEAVRLIELYRGHDYPGTRTAVSRAEVEELFRWWLEERKRP